MYAFMFLHLYINISTHKKHALCFKVLWANLYVMVFKLYILSPHTNPTPKHTITEINMHFFYVQTNNSILYYLPG